MLLIVSNVLTNAGVHYQLYIADILTRSIRFRWEFKFNKINS